MKHNVPSAAVGFIASAVVRDGDAIFTLTLTDESVTDLSAIVTYQDGQQDRSILQRPETGQERRLKLALNGAASPIRTIHLQGMVNDECRELELNEDGCHLHRLLSLNLAEINENLRWRNRISDLDTRFFAAKNSLRAIGEDFELLARCIVSVGWEGLEQENDTIIDWCRSQYPLISRFDVSPDDHEALVSTLVFWCHLAIYDGCSEQVAKLSEATLEALYAPHAKGIAVYNMLHISLLLGGWHLAQGRHAVAANIFGPSDRLLRLAVREYPRALINYRELVTVAEKAFYCQIGLGMARGNDILKPFPLLLPEIAWREGNRLRKPESRQRLLEKYLAFCHGT